MIRRKTMSKERHKGPRARKESKLYGRPKNQKSPKIPKRKDIKASTHRNSNVRQILPRLHHLRRQLIWRQHPVIQRLRPKLESAGDEAGFGVRMEGVEERRAAVFPFGGAVEAELQER